jgi:hypothetical protein
VKEKAGTGGVRVATLNLWGRRVGEEVLLQHNELQGLREGRVVFYEHHPLHRHTSCPTNRPSTTLTETGQNVHSTKELDPKRISRSVHPLENTHDTGIILPAEPERGSHFV